MSIATVVTRGFGTFGTAALVVTAGYSIGVALATDPVIITVTGLASGPLTVTGAASSAITVTGRASSAISVTGVGGSS